MAISSFQTVSQISGAARPWQPADGTPTTFRAAYDFGAETATRLLHRLQRQLWAEAVVIPLWEIQPHFVTRKQVRGLPAAPMTLFQGIDRWQVDAWYPPE